MKKNKNILQLSILLLALFITACSSGPSEFTSENGPETPPLVYKNVSVHDPSIVKGEDGMFIVGSHLAGAKTKDYVDWIMHASGPKNGNPIIPNVEEDFKEAFEWAETDTFWASDIVQLKDGKYYHYYSVCEGSMPLAAIGVAVSDTVEGPYEDMGMFLKSGKSGKLLAYEPDHHVQYDPNIHPNAIDPTVFYDAEGDLQMVYGSYSGGIYILEMDEETKLPKAGQGYGTRLTGGKHTRIENPYIIYDEDTKFYYLYMSFGGLGSGHGYQTRVARSENVDGPYLDAKGQDINEIKNHAQGFFDDDTINKFGYKVMGDFDFLNNDGTRKVHGYVSPGGASFIHDKDIDRTLMVFHTRFVNKGEAHEIRAHEVYMNEDGWPTVAPYRYSGVEHTKQNQDATGNYQLILNNLQIEGDLVQSIYLELHKDGSYKTDKETGKWSQDGSFIEVEYNGVMYKGLALLQWDSKKNEMVKTFTAQGSDNTSIWGIEN